MKRFLCLIVCVFVLYFSACLKNSSNPQPQSPKIIHTEKIGNIFTKISACDKKIFIELIKKDESIKICGMGGKNGLFFTAITFVKNGEEITIKKENKGNWRNINDESHPLPDVDNVLDNLRIGLMGLLSNPVQDHSTLQNFEPDGEMLFALLDCLKL